MIIAQITDLHLGRVLETPAGPLDPLDCLAKAVDHLKAMDPGPDLLLVTGDLSNSGAAEDYRALKDRLDDLQRPYFVIPGNHDRRDTLRQAFAAQGYFAAGQSFLHHVIEDYPLRLIGLDTLVPDAEGGEMCDRRLDWLAARLADAPGKPTLIYMHHPPFKTGIPLFDQIGCAGGEALGALVARHQQVQAVTCGHVHRAISLRWYGTVVYVTPSVFYQYPLELRDGETFQPVSEPPACRLFVWTPGVGLVSHLSYF